MKRLTILFISMAVLLLGHKLNAQTVDWNLAGNSPALNNFLGTVNGQPLRIKTANVIRSKFNPNVAYTVNGYNMPHNGHLLVGVDNNSISGSGSIYGNLGAFSLLHLNGTGSQFQEYGYRPWMETGLTLTANQDLSYLGLRKLSTDANEEDITETVLLWSDNPSATNGPDKLVFRFSGYGGNDGAAVSADLHSTTDLDALHVAQFTGTGLMGLGNTFGTNATGMTGWNRVS